MLKLALMLLCAISAHALVPVVRAAQGARLVDRRSLLHTSAAALAASFAATATPSLALEDLGDLDAPTAEPVKMMPVEANDGFVAISVVTKTGKKDPKDTP